MTTLHTENDDTPPVKFWSARGNKRAWVHMGRTQMGEETEVAHAVVTRERGRYGITYALALIMPVSNASQNKIKRGHARGTVYDRGDGVPCVVATRTGLTGVMAQMMAEAHAPNTTDVIDKAAEDAGWKDDYKEDLIDLHTARQAETYIQRELFAQQQRLRSKRHDQ